MAGKRSLPFVFGLILLIGTAAKAYADDGTSYTSVSSSALPVEVDQSASDTAVVDSPQDELARLLTEEAMTRKRYDDLVKKMNKFKWAAAGLGGVLGGATLLGFLKGLHSMKGNWMMRKSGKAVHLGASAVALLSLIGGFTSYWYKKKAEERAKDHAKQLLRQRQAMLAELQEGDSRETEVMDRVDEIADLTENLGLYDPEVDAAVRAASD